MNDYATARLIATCVLEQSKRYARKTWRSPSARCYASSPSNMPSNISRGTTPLIDTICESPAISVRKKKLSKNGYILTARSLLLAVGMVQWLRRPIPICLPYEGTVPLRRLLLQCYGLGNVYGLVFVLRPGASLTPPPKREMVLAGSRTRAGVKGVGT